VQTGTTQHVVAILVLMEGEPQLRALSHSGSWSTKPAPASSSVKVASSSVKVVVGDHESRRCAGR
jgi:hypothetical protein